MPLKLTPPVKGIIIISLEGIHGGFVVGSCGPIVGSLRRWLCIVSSCLRSEMACRKPGVSGLGEDETRTARV